MNTLRPAIEVDADGKITAFAVLQEAAPDYPTIRPHRLVIGFYNLHGGKLRRDFRHELDVDGERTEVPELVGQQRPDLVLINDEDLAYAKVRLDDASLEVAMEHLEDIDDPLARAIVWGAAWDATRDAEARASDYVALVLDNIAAETESTTIRTTLTQLLTVARAYVDPAKRDATIRAVGDRLWALAQGAEAGSDAQFQFVKFFANIASTPEHVVVLDGLLKGTAPLNGLEIDTDLGWELLEGLVLNGAAGDPEIDEFLDKDETSNGHQAAARARATHNTAQAKREAFLALSDSDKLSNAIVRNVTIGYQHTNDPSSLQELIAPYFDALNDIWANRSYKIAEHFVLGLYPTPLASQELVDATRAWLDANTDTPALRRLVTENLAGVERALRAQERDKS